MCVCLLASTSTNPAYRLPLVQNLLHPPSQKSLLPPLNIHSKYFVYLRYRWFCFTMLIIFNLQPNIFPVCSTYSSYSTLNTSTQVSYGHLIFLSLIKLIIFSPEVCFPPMTPPSWLMVPPHTQLADRGPSCFFCRIAPLSWTPWNQGLCLIQHCIPRCQE